MDGCRPPSSSITWMPSWGGRLGLLAEHLHSNGVSCLIVSVVDWGTEPFSGDNERCRPLGGNGKNNHRPPVTIGWKPKGCLKEPVLQRKYW